MNDALDALAVSIYNNFLPEAWALKAPKTEKTLSKWLE